jgi:hypothetical protein
MKLLVRVVLVLVLAVSAYPLAAPNLGLMSRAEPTVGPERELAKANYDLASRWTSAKVGKYVFSTAVTPHWLEFSDRFWYDYETPAGRKWSLVDPVKKTKTPLFDNAKMAAQLTRILRTPYDAQHLPVSTIRFIDNDTKIRFSVTLPRDAKVENAAGEEITGMTQTQDQGRGAAVAVPDVAAAGVVSSNSRVAVRARRARRRRWATPRGGSNTNSRRASWF